jgi:hypothetical protein
METIRLLVPPHGGEADEHDDEEDRNKRGHDHRPGTKSDKRIAMPLRKESNHGSSSSSPPGMSLCEAALDVDLSPPQRMLSIEDPPPFDEDRTAMDNDLLLVVNSRTTIATNTSSRRRATKRR